MIQSTFLTSLQKCKNSVPFMCCDLIDGPQIQKIQGHYRKKTVNSRTSQATHTISIISVGRVTP